METGSGKSAVPVLSRKPLVMNLSGRGGTNPAVKPHSTHLVRGDILCVSSSGVRSACFLKLQIMSGNRFSASFQYLKAICLSVLLLSVSQGVAEAAAGSQALPPSLTRPVPAPKATREGTRPRPGDVHRSSPWLLSPTSCSSPGCPSPRGSVRPAPCWCHSSGAPSVPAAR